MSIDKIKNNFDNFFADINVQITILLAEFNGNLIEYEEPPYNIPINNDLEPNVQVDGGLFITWDKIKIPQTIYPDPINDSFDEIDPPPSLEIPISKPLISFFVSFSQTFSLTINQKQYGFLNAHPIIYNVFYQSKYNNTSELLLFYTDFLQTNLDFYKENINFLGLTKTDISNNPLLKIKLPHTSSNVLICGDNNLNKLYAFYSTRNKELTNFKHNIRFVKEFKRILPTKNTLTENNNNVFQNIIINNNVTNNFITDQLDKITIPLEILDDYKGKRKNELQIIWRHELYKTNKSEKIINLPTPKPQDELSAKLIKAVLPEKFEFGLTKYDLLLKYENVENWKETIKAIVYGVGSDPSIHSEFIENVYKIWLKNLCEPDVYLKQWTVTLLDNDSIKPLKTGIYVPYKAIYMGWESESQNRWIKKARWLLN